MDFFNEFEAIRKDRMGVVSSSVYPGLKELVSQIYPDEAHFIYELLQNAEDARATEVRFKIEKEYLVFEHNGAKLFDANDIEGITNIGKSTKKENYVQAGKFGIGFKSVYAFTETPYIFCDSINFKIEKLLLPTPIDALVGKEEGWTVFRFPYDSPKISPSEAKRKIKQGLLEIESTTLLFLNNIKSITYTLEDKSVNEVVKSNVGNIVTSEVKCNGKIRSTSKWKRFTRDTKLNGKNVSVALAFPMEAGKDDVLNFVAGEDKVCITFLAKNEKSNLKIFINAPFGCTPARDTVNKEDVDNKILIGELAILMKEVLGELKSEKMLTDELFNILPIEDDEIPEFYSPIVAAIYDSFRDNSFLPTVDNGFVTVSNGIMSSRNVIDRTFTIEDIKYLYMNDDLQFVKNKPVTSRAYRFLKKLQIEELTPNSILERIIDLDEKYFNEWLCKLNTKHLCEFYSYLDQGIVDLKKNIEKYERYEYYTMHSWYREDDIYSDSYEKGLIYKKSNESYNKIKQIALVRADNGKFYLPNQIRLLTQKIDVPEEYKLVDRKLADDKNVITFFKNIGVIEFTEKELESYFYKQETTEFIASVKKISDTDNPVEVARMILKYFKNHKYDEVKLNQAKYVWINSKYDGGKGKCVETPQNCYLDTPYLDTGFKDIESLTGKKEISEEYVQLTKEELEEWIKFLKYQGILSEIAVERKNYSTGYVTGYHYDYVIDHLQHYFSKKSKEFNLFVWKFFNEKEGWDYSYAYERKQINRNYCSHTNDSSLLKILKETAWILDDTGKFCTPSNVSEKNISQNWKIDFDESFLDAIGFGAKQRKIDEEIHQKEEKLRLEQDSEREAAEKLGFENTDDVIEAKEILKMARELQDYGVDLKEILDSKKKERTKEKRTLKEQLQQLKSNEFVKNEVFDDGEVYRVPNPERRTEKLNETMEQEKAPDKKEKLVKKSSSNQEEKQFVGTEYSGRCQICDKIIFKKDGKRHFVAADLLDTGHLEEQYLNGLSTGWNTLCMCPNCSAEYKYGAVSIKNFETDVKNTEIENDYADYYEFPIAMQGEERKIKYTPRHLLALQTALKFFDENQDVDAVHQKDIDNDVKKSDGIIEISGEVCVLSAGDRCPICKTSNIKSTLIHVKDKLGSVHDVNGRVCKCGNVYFTHKEGIQLPQDININEIKQVVDITPKKKKVPTQVQIVTVKKKGITIKSQPQICPRCGLDTVFSNKGMCFECFKYEQNSRYE